MKSLLRSKFAKGFAWSALAVVLIFAIYWLHLLNHAGIDDWVERYFLRYASQSADTRKDGRVIAITIDPAKTESLGPYDDEITANQQWRKHHAQLLTKLAAAGTRVVAFDSSFPAPIAEFTAANTELVDAIRKVTEGGKTAVLTGYELGMQHNPALEAVLPRDKMGLLNIKETSRALTTNDYLARVLLAESAVTLTDLGAHEQIIKPLPMPLAMYVAYYRSERGDPTLSIDPSRGALVITWERGAPTLIDVEIRSCERDEVGCERLDDLPDATILRRAVLPLWMGRALPSLPFSYASVLGQDTLDVQHYGNHVVLVGALTKKEKQDVGPGGPADDVYGVHVHERVFIDLLKGSYLRHAPAWLQLLSFVLVLLAGLLARLYMPIKVVKIPIGWLKDFPLPIGFFLVAGVYLFIAAMIFRSTSVFFDLGYQLLALAAGYFAVPALAGLTGSPDTEAKK